MVRFRKVGYTPLLMAVSNSPRDTLPLTVLLHPSGVSLPTVVTTGRNNVRGPADTVRRLDKIGFYDRRATTGAPASAFVTSEKIERLTLLSEVSNLTGPPICFDNLYLDGVQVQNISAAPKATKAKARNLRSNGLDQIVDIGAVLAVETYRVSDIPQGFNGTAPGGSSCGARLIWTK